MPRKSENVRVEFLLSPEQYEAFVNWVEAESWIDDVKKPGGKGAMGEALRELLTWTIPNFAAAKPLVERGRYERKQKRMCECCGVRAEQIPAPDRGAGYYECSECGCIGS